MPNQTSDADDLDLSILGLVDRVIHEPARLQIVAWLSVLEEALRSRQDVRGRGHDCERRLILIEISS